MATVMLRLQDAHRAPLDDVVDVDVTDTQTGAVVATARDVPGRRRLRFTKLAASRPYRLRVFPKRYRPVGRFVVTPHTSDGTTEVTVHCPVQPERVAHPSFPGYRALDPSLRRVLEASTLEGGAGAAEGSTPGERIFNGLDDLQRAGLLNLFCKMRHTPTAGLSAWEFVTGIYRIRGDRLFADVRVDFRDTVKNGVAAGMFRVVDGSLHRPGPGFEGAGSFKTDDPYGNLQLSFFASLEAPLAFRLDADVDDAAGIRHAFQVIGNFFSGGTHPYDIHQILTFHQALPVGYRLNV